MLQICHPYGALHASPKSVIISINALGDLGYQGIRNDYKGDRIEIPTKKPGKQGQSETRAERGGEGREPGTVRRALEYDTSQ